MRLKNVDALSILRRYVQPTEERGKCDFRTVALYEAQPSMRELPARHEFVEQRKACHA
jgi:hypothetical protein